MKFLESEFTLEQLLANARSGKYKELVEEFLETDKQVVRLNFAELDSASKGSVQNGVNHFARTRKLAVKCLLRNGDLYLINPNGSIK